MSNIDPRKIGILLVHMSLGMLILGLTVIRFIVRLLTGKPADATTGYAALDRSARLAHYSFYLLVVLMAGSGLATAILAGLNRRVFQKTSEALPATFSASTRPTLHRPIGPDGMTANAQAVTEPACRVRRIIILRFHLLGPISGTTRFAMWLRLTSSRSTTSR